MHGTYFSRDRFNVSALESEIIPRSGSVITVTETKDTW